MIANYLVKFNLKQLQKKAEVVCKLSVSMKTSKAINKGDKRINGLKLSCTSVSVGYVSDSLSLCQVKHIRNGFSWHFHPLALFFQHLSRIYNGQMYRDNLYKIN